MRDKASSIKAIVASMIVLLGLAIFAGCCTAIAYADTLGRGHVVGHKTLSDCVRDCTTHTIYGNGQHTLACAVGSGGVLGMVAVVLIGGFALSWVFEG